MYPFWEIICATYQVSATLDDETTRTDCKKKRTAHRIFVAFAYARPEETLFVFVRAVSLREKQCRELQVAAKMRAREVSRRSKRRNPPPMHSYVPSLLEPLEVLVLGNPPPKVILHAPREGDHPLVLVSAPLYRLPHAEVLEVVLHRLPLALPRLLRIVGAEERVLPRLHARLGARDSHGRGHQEGDDDLVHREEGHGERHEEALDVVVGSDGDPHRIAGAGRRRGHAEARYSRRLALTVGGFFDDVDEERLC